MATNPFAEFISGEALTSQPQMSYLAMLGDQTPNAPGRSMPGMAQSEMFGSPFGTSPAGTSRASSRTSMTSSWGSKVARSRADRCQHRTFSSSCRGSRSRSVIQLCRLR